MTKLLSVMRYLYLLMMVWSTCASAQAVDADSFDFKAVDVSTAISLYLAEVSKQPYLLCGDVLSDTRKVSIRASGKVLTGPLFSTLLSEHGFSASNRGGLVYVCKKDAAMEEATDTLLYRVKYRDSAYLVDLVSSLVKGMFANRRAPAAGALSVGGDKAGATHSLAEPSTGGAYRATDTDEFIVFSGAHKEIVKLQKLLDQLDTATGEVVVKAVLYEVATGRDSGSAFALALSVLGGKLGLNLGVPGTMTNAITFKSISIDTAVSALSRDSRFKTVSTPSLRVRSGAQAHLTVGQDVPTLGAVSYPQGGGQAIQSVEYRSSGVILDITPEVRDAGIDLHVVQQISDFVKTETGVNGSPTLTKRSFSTDVTVAPGELVLLGGLTQDKNSEARSGFSFLPKLLQSSNLVDNRTEVLLLLQVDKVVR